MGPPSEYQFCDGYYKADAGFFKLLKVAGGVLSYHNEVRDITRTIQVEYGDFGPAEEGIVQQCGEREGERERRYNIKLSQDLDLGTAQEFGVISRDGLRATVKSILGTYHLEWLAEDQPTGSGLSPHSPPLI